MDFPDVENVRVEVLEPSGSSKAKRRRGAPDGDPSKIGQKGYSKYGVRLGAKPKNGEEKTVADKVKHSDAIIALVKLHQDGHLTPQEFQDKIISVTDKMQ